jgi:hypothetical protein
MLDQIKECLMHAGVFAEFGMESCGHYFSLPNCDRIAAFSGNYFDSGTNALDLGGADEDHFDRLTT